MSLGDYLRLLRARHGGVTPAQIEAAVPDLPKGLYRQIEQRYRAVGDEATLRPLAEYFGVPLAEMLWRLDWPRKALSRALASALSAGRPITLFLADGLTVSGQVLWWDLGACALATPEGEWVVQRHAVERWDTRSPEDDDPGPPGRATPVAIA